MGRRLPGRRLRHLPVAPVLPDHPARAGGGGPGRWRQSVADLSAHLHAARQARPRHAGHLHVHVDLERPHQPADLPAPARPVHDDASGWRSSRASSSGKWPEMMAGALVSLAPMIILFVLGATALRARHRPERAQGVTEPPGAMPLTALPAAVAAADGRQRRAAAAVPGDRRAQPPRRRVRRRLAERARPPSSPRRSTRPGVEAIVDLDGGWGDGPARARSSAGSGRFPAASRCSPASTTSAGPSDAAFGETEAARLRDGVAGGRPRTQGLEDARPARARPGRAARGGRRSASRPALGRGRGAARARDRSMSPTRSPSSTRSTRPTSAGRSCRAIPTGISGRRGRRAARTSRASRRSTSSSTGSRPSSPAIRRRRSSARTSAARPRTWDGSIGCSSAYPNWNVDIAARIAELGRQPRRTRELFERWPDRILFGVDSGPDPAFYAVHYRFLETTDESFPYDVDDGEPPTPGPLGDPRPRPVGRRAAAGLPGQRAAAHRVRLRAMAGPLSSAGCRSALVAGGR